MMGKTLIFGFFLVILLHGPLLSAFDNGLNLTNTSAWEDYGATGEDMDSLVFRGSLIPWFFIPLGDNAEIHVSAGITAEYEHQEWRPVPELLRTNLSMRFGSSAEFTLGRMLYSDPLGFIAVGLFDGLRFTHDLGISSLGIGVWYTGFLYKKNTTITMTEADEIRHIMKLDHSNFSDSYFTSRRLVAALDWEHPGVMELVRLKSALIGQFDLNEETSFNSQYLAVKTLIPVNNYFFDLGGSFGLVQNEGNTQITLAGEAGAGVFLPTSIQDSLRFSARYSSGIFSDTLTAFVPITTVSQGNILKAKLSGLSTINIDYTARLVKSFSLSLLSTYFILNDMGSYWGIPYGRDGYFLGNEFYAQTVWSPVSDLQLRAGGGVFLPRLGNADPQSPMLWRIELNLVFSLL